MLATREDDHWCPVNRPNTEGFTPTEDRGQHSSRVQVRGSICEWGHADLEYRAGVLEMTNLDDGRCKSQKSHCMATVRVSQFWKDSVRSFSN